MQEVRVLSNDHLVHEKLRKKVEGMEKVSNIKVIGINDTANGLHLL